MKDTLIKTRQKVMVIGYGNELRSDDGVGQRVADAVTAWELPNVHSVAVHQLVPELADTLATVDIAIFVDAHPGIEEVQVFPLEPAHVAVTIGHASNPRLLLAIAELLYGHHPQGWLIAIPAHNFHLGNCLSPIAERGMAEALDWIDYLIRIPQEQTALLYHKKRN